MAHMSHIWRKPVLGGSNQVLHKLGCTVTEDGKRLENMDLESRGIVQSLAKTKVLISCTLTAWLICTFVFAY